jgi:hypothetical protein
LEVSEQDAAAEVELSQLESKMGIGSRPIAQPTVTATTDSSVMDELNRLEAKIGGGSNSSN